MIVLTGCINEEMLRTGYAWHYLKYDNNNSWDSLEREAKIAKRGLWVQLNPIPPWEWKGN